jgi:hypothetical protein
MPYPRPDADHLPFDERREPSTLGEAAAPPSASQSEGAPTSRDARIFRDADGVTWWVHEVAGEHLGTVGATCLLVVSANELRRIWKFPAHWRQLSPADLLALPQQGLSSRAGSSR